jgi:hypothetical protein
MAKKVSYQALMKMAKSYGVSDNALFISAANQYITQQKVIEMIRAQLEAEESVVVTKEYVKDRENVYVNPMVRELPKHSDSANKTLAMMLDIIVKLGREPQPQDELTAFLDGEE